MKLGKEVEANEIIIYESPSTLIMADWFQSLVKHSELKWEYDDMLNMGYLTLKQISDQLIALGYGETFTVIQEDCLDGCIYTYGNYNPESWILTGKTMGYA